LPLSARITNVPPFSFASKYGAYRHKFDPKEVASTFTENAIWQNPFGVRLHGSAEIEEFLTDLLARSGFRAGESTSPTKILDLRLASPTTAVVWSDERIEVLVNDYSGHPMPLGFKA
jgi:hypothetical protein